MINKRALQVAVVILVIVGAGLGYLNISTHSDLSATKNDLVDTQNQLAITQDQLTRTEANLSDTQSQLATTKNQLTQTQSQLTNASNKLSAVTGLPSPIINVGTYLEGSKMVDGESRDIVLIGNPNATNPTWAELMAFLSTDDTCKQTYIDPSFVCSNFTEMLYYHAEKAGIKAGYVNINFGSFSICAYDFTTGCNACIGGFHACNAFNTTDRGLVFIDDTGTIDGDGEPTTVNITIGKTYQPISIFSTTRWCPMGTVQDFNVVW